LKKVVAFNINARHQATSRLVDCIIDNTLLQTTQPLTLFTARCTLVQSAVLRLHDVR